MSAERLSKSLAVLEERALLVAGEVERAMRLPLDLPDIEPAARWISTGAGSSEGPARLLAALLRARGRHAEFVPISTFLGEPPRGDVCVVISQCLSPNARVPLSRASAYRHVVLVTTVEDAAASIGNGHETRVIRHGPHEEDGLLLRVVGPAVANALVMRIAAAGGTSQAPTAPVSLGDARARALHAIREVPSGALGRLVGLVGIGEDVTLCDGLRHKLLEGLGRVHPVWDLCGLVHGPFQSFYDREATLVLLEREGQRPDLTDRLKRVLHPERHALVRLRSAAPGPLALLDFDLQLDWLLVEALRAAPRDLLEWPGKGHDAPLYDLGR
jgi:hypothetical protein